MPRNKKKWRDLSPGVKRVVIAAGAVDASLKVVALVDLARRPASEIRGSKVAWAAAITVVNSVGVLPVVYFVRGRRR